MKENTPEFAPDKAELQKHLEAFNQTHLCNNLERLLYRGPVRQARRQFERLFARHWPDIKPGLSHPRLSLVVAEYQKRFGAASGGGKVPE